MASFVSHRDDDVKWRNQAVQDMNDSGLCCMAMLSSPNDDRTVAEEGLTTVDSKREGSVSSREKHVCVSEGREGHG